MPNKYIEIQKYPYCGRIDETEDYLSEKICCYNIKIRKKIIKIPKQLIVYGDFVLCLTNGIVPSQGIGLPILPNTPAIMKVSHSNVGLSKKLIIAQVIVK